ncbi:MAG TPA: hypothetical protein VGO47_06575 [Chlamydiales bacterium]|nr:hypothetical protein [Chlamydiales bacterium]
MSKSHSKASSNVRKLVNPFQRVVKHTDLTSSQSGLSPENRQSFVITERPPKKIKVNETKESGSGQSLQGAAAGSAEVKVTPQVFDNTLF